MHRTLRTLAVALATLALSVSLAAGTLIGAFDVGPGGSPVPSGPWYNTAGNTWISKIWTPLVSLNEDASGPRPAAGHRLERQRRLHRLDLRPAPGRDLARRRALHRRRRQVHLGVGVRPRHDRGARDPAGQAARPGRLHRRHGHGDRRHRGRRRPHRALHHRRARPPLPEHADPGLHPAGARPHRRRVRRHAHDRLVVHGGDRHRPLHARRVRGRRVLGPARQPRLLARRAPARPPDQPLLRRRDGRHPRPRGRRHPVHLRQRRRRGGPRRQPRLRALPGAVGRHQLPDVQLPRAGVPGRPRAPGLPPRHRPRDDRRGRPERHRRGRPLHHPFEAFWPEEYETYPYDPARARQLLAEAGWDGTAASRSRPTTPASSTPTPWRPCSSS
jgi:hypothetical protein